MHDPALHVAARMDELLAANPPVGSLDVRFGEYPFRIRSNRRELLSELAGYFIDFPQQSSEPAVVIDAIEADELPQHPDAEEVPREDGKKLKEIWIAGTDGRIVWKTRTGMSFLFTPDRHLAVGPCMANPNQVVNFVNNRHIDLLLQRDAVLAHAAGVSIDGRGIVLAAVAGSGKSTLALHLMARGCEFVSNDRVVLSRQPDGHVKMDGIAKMPRINPGTILHNPALSDLLPGSRRTELELLPRDELWQLEEKYDVPITRIFGPNRFRLHADVQAIVLLTWQRVPGETIVSEPDLSTRPDLMDALMKTPGVFTLRRDLDGARLTPVPEPYLNCLQGVKIVELSGGLDFDRGCDVCLELLKDKESVA